MSIKINAKLMYDILTQCANSFQHKSHILPSFLLSKNEILRHGCWPQIGTLDIIKFQRLFNFWRVSDPQRYNCVLVWEILLEDDAYNRHCLLVRVFLIDLPIPSERSQITRLIQRVIIPDLFLWQENAYFVQDFVSWHLREEIILRKSAKPFSVYFSVWTLITVFITEWNQVVQVIFHRFGMVDSKILKIALP